MPATDKATLLDVTEAEFTKLNDLIAPLTPAIAMVQDEGGISIKDIIGHRAHWIRLFQGWYSDGLAGKEVHFPAKGYKWNELPRYNADLRARQSDLDWPTACRDLHAAHADLTNLVTSLDNAALYGGLMKGAQNAWTIGRWAEAAGPSHYRSASKYVRKRLKELA